LQLGAELNSDSFANGDSKKKYEVCREEKMKQVGV
jgi:hypothetical protein